MGLQKAQNYVHVDTPNPYEADLQTAFELLQREIDETQGWEGAHTIHGCCHNGEPCALADLLYPVLTRTAGREEKDDVILEKKLLPGAAAGDLPIVRLCSLRPLEDSVRAY